MDDPNIEYVYGLEIDTLAMLVRNGGAEKLSVTRNSQWSVTALVDSTGAVKERYAYDHFGVRTILAPDGSTERSTSDYNNPYGYTSRRHDDADETGMMYYRERYYDVFTGEFVSKDPLEYVDGMSTYRGYFVPNHTDPTGRSFGGWLACYHALGPWCGCVITSIPLITRGGVYEELADNCPGLPGLTDTRHLFGGGITIADGTAANAMVHCLAGCKLAFLCGKCCARIASMCRERRNKKRERFDMFNDLAGIKCVPCYRFGVNCLECCKEKLGSGGLLTNFPRPGGLPYGVPVR